MKNYKMRKNLMNLHLFLKMTHNMLNKLILAKNINDNF